MFHYITFISFPLSLAVKNNINNTKTLRFHSKTSFLAIKSGCLMAKSIQQEQNQAGLRTLKKRFILGSLPKNPPHRVPQQGGSEDARLLIGRLLDLKSSCGGKVVRFVRCPNNGWFIWVEAGKKHCHYMFDTYFVGCNQYEIRTKPRSKVAITQKE